MLIIIVLWTAFFVINFNIVMMVPLLPFMARDIGLTPGETGLVLSAFPLVALISNLALGPLIDRYGRKRFIILGALGSGGLLLATALAQSATIIIVSRAATGVFMPMIGASVFAAVADYVPLPERSRFSGYVTSAAPIAFLCAISLGVLFGGLVSWRLPIIALAALSLVLAMFAARLPKTNPALLSRDPIARATYRKRLATLSLDAGSRLLILSYFGWSFGMYVFLGLYPSWLVEHGLASAGAGTISLMLFIGEIGGLFGALLSGALATRARHPLATCAWAALGMTFLIIAIPFGAGAPLFQALAYGGFAFGRDLMLALILGGAMLLVSPDERGSLNAMLNAVYQTGASLGGVAGAWLYGLRADFTANSAVSALTFAAAAIMLWGITRLQRISSAGS